MAGREYLQMKELNLQLKQFIGLQERAKEEAKATAKAAKEAANQQTVVMKALGLQYDKNNKIFDKTGMRLNEMGQEINRAGERVSNFNKRSTVLTKTIEKLNTQGKSFEITSKKSFNVYKEQGGNVFEYLAEAISGTREEITIFGQEGAKIRKVMYGFLPPGTFRALNKMSSILQAVGSATRRNSRSTADYTKDINKLKKAQEGLSTDDDDYKELQEAINKKREEMLSGNSILGTTMKALGKIPRLGKFKGALESKESRERRATANLPLGQSLEEAKARKKELIKKSKMMTQGAGGVYQQVPLPAGEQSELAELTKNLTPLSNIDKLQDGVIEGIMTSPLVKIFGGISKMIAGTRLLLAKVFSKESWGKIKDAAKIGMKFMFSLMIYLTLFFVLVYFFRKPLIAMFNFVSEFIKNQWPSFKEQIFNAFNLIKTGFMDIYEGFKNGDLIQVIMGAWKIVGGVLYGLFLAASAIVSLALVAVAGFFVGIGKRIYQFGKDFINGDFGKKIKLAALAVGVIATILIGWPAIIALAIGAGIGALKRALNVKLPFFANGGVVTNDGMQVVGERGPELVSLPKGSRVHSNSNSRRMNASGTVNNFNITIHAKDSSKAEMRRMADEIGRMINSKINRSTSSSTLR